MTKIRVKRGLSENLDSVSIEGEKMNKIKFRRGSLNNKKNIDIEDGEPIYLTDTKRLYVSNEDVAINNVYVGSQEPNDPGINVWIDPQGVNNVIDMMYPIGSIYISATNTDPSSIFGGTWELIDKEFSEFYNKYSGAELSNYVTDGAGATCTELSIIRSGHSIFIRLYMTTKMELWDTTTTLVTLNLPALGLNSLTYTGAGDVYASDGGNGIIMANLNDTGSLSFVDCITKSGTALVEGATPRVLVDRTTIAQNMIDEFCDKFYWKRTA